MKFIMNDPKFYLLSFFEYHIKRNPTINNPTDIGSMSNLKNLIN